MLKLKHTRHFEIPHLSLLDEPMRLSNVPIDNDELTQAIVEDPIAHDDTWELSERPDMGELTKFWSDVETDVANDPEWFTFSEDD
jgi:hypothetical protein